MKKHKFLPVIWVLTFFMGAASAFGDEAAYYRQKAEQAFADQRYLQAASFATQALYEKPPGQADTYSAYPCFG